MGWGWKWPSVEPAKTERSFELRHREHRGHRGRSMRFKDRVCLVTGGGSGIGRATCMRMAEEGGRAVVIDHNDIHGKETVAIIEKSGGSAIFAKADVGNPSDIRSAIDAAIKKWSRIDVLVN